MFSNFFNLFSDNPKERAIRLLQKSARGGDIQAQQMLRLYHTLQSRHFNPMHESVYSVIEDKLIVDILSDSKKPIKKDVKRSKRARNPKIDK